MSKVWIIVTILLVLGCQSTNEKQNVPVRANKVKYASNFHFEYANGQEYLVVSQPWPNATKMIRYALDSLPTTFVCTSTSHLPFFEMLGKTEQVIGFPNVQYITSTAFNRRVDEGHLLDLGPDGSINLELLIGLNPSAIIGFDMGSESQNLDKIKELGIPVYYNADFLEDTPLGRAEWIKFFGALLDRQQEADSIFAEIEARYLSLVELAVNVESIPTILSGVVYGDTWFLPGGNNWASNFFDDAGGEYLWASDSASGWLELSFESVYSQAYDADYWIGTSTVNSRKELIGQDKRYETFQSFRKDQVYNYNKAIGPKGGYDFFESGYARPDLVLSDLIRILHPELLPGYETVYFQGLE